MRIILEDRDGYGHKVRRVERADKRDRKKARAAKRFARHLDGAVAWR